MNRLQIGQSVKVGEVTIIPIEQISIDRETRPHMHWWHGSKQVYALVILSSTGMHAMDTDAREVNVNELIARVPQLIDLLDSHAKDHSIS